MQTLFGQFCVSFSYAADEDFVQDLAQTNSLLWEFILINVICLDGGIMAFQRILGHFIRSFVAGMTAEHQDILINIAQSLLVKYVRARIGQSGAEAIPAEEVRNSLRSITFFFCLVAFRVTIMSDLQAMDVDRKEEKIGGTAVASCNQNDISNMVGEDDSWSQVVPAVR